MGGERGCCPSAFRGCGRKGNQVSQVACTLNVSRGGAPRRARAASEGGEPGVATYHPDEGRFEVVWNAAKSSRASGRRGLCCLESADRFWVAELGCGLDPEDCRQLLMQVLGE